MVPAGLLLGTYLLLPQSKEPTMPFLYFIRVGSASEELRRHHLPWTGSTCLETAAAIIGECHTIMNGPIWPQCIHFVMAPTTHFQNSRSAHVFKVWDPKLITIFSLPVYTCCTTFLNLFKAIFFDLSTTTIAWSSIMWSRRMHMASHIQYWTIHISLFPGLL